MAKLRLYGCMLALLIASGLNTYAQYPLKISLQSPDSILTIAALGIPASFKDRNACVEYVYLLPGLLQDKGFASASIDSVHFDSTYTFIQLYIGDRFSWSSIRVRPGDASMLREAGWTTKKLTGKPARLDKIQSGELLLLNYLENNGYPFARISLDSISIERGALSAILKIEKGPLYKIDSIRIYGASRISSAFMERYLGIPKGSIYRKDKLESISKRILELPYVQEDHPWSVTMLGTGSILDLYLKPKRSSQIDVLVGFLPNNDQLSSSKLLVTGEATANLKNPFGNGESIGLNWQQLQAKSPRLNIYFQQPYLFHSAYGVNAAFSLYKKDSSFLTTQGTLGIQFSSSPSHIGTVFIQSTGSSLLNVDTLQVVSTRRLPAIADVSATSVGASYEINNTNYRFNPVRGNEFLFTGSVGTKKVKKNSQISKLVDPSDPEFDYGSLYDTFRLSSYQFRLNLVAAHYFGLSHASTIRLGVNAGWYQSANTFRNELFQIGGYKLLRGFDEESILASEYTVSSLEYRYLIGMNSYLFAFLDGGWAKNDVPVYRLNSIYLGLGLGLAFETKAGIFNISYAIGKQDNNPFAVRQAKIHLGYVNFF
ncbi:MAG: BamA/TamA family outer membrane protein [Bacteroidota bacterium]|nr:BamA/TamA family outer membrane protein [Bacteroidota bacterium]